MEQLKEEKKARKTPINFTFYDSDRLCTSDTALRKNFGYAALSQIYHELEINKFLVNRQRHSGEQYDANTIMKMLVYSRLLFPASKKASYENREIFFEKTDYSNRMMFTGALLFLTSTAKTSRSGLMVRSKKNTTGIPA